MKNIARMELQPGMVTSEDVLNYKGEVILAKNSTITQKLIDKLARYSIMVVPIKEDIDFATTHFEKVRLSEGFKKFDANYQKFFPVYKTIMMNTVLNGAPLQMDNLMKVYDYIMAYAPTGEILLDYLYNMLPSEDDMTHAHCLDSALIAGVFGVWLGLPNEDIKLLIRCAFVYDIGKLSIPPEILWKPGKLTPQEYDLVKKHTEVGYEFLKNQDLDEHILNATLMHHERADGTGYPNHLVGADIDRFAKYIAIVDTYQAMCSPRTYRQSLNPFQIIGYYDRECCIRYDESIIRPILSHIASTQLGMNVQLSTGDNAEVILINEKKLSKPLVKTLKDDLLLDLSTMNDVTIDRLY